MDFVSGKEGLVNGIAGALSAIVSYSVGVWKNHRSFSVLKLTQKAIAGFASGAITGSIGDFIVNKIKKGWQIAKILNALMKATIGALIGEW